MENQYNTRKVEELTYDLLKGVGVPFHLKGYRALEVGIPMVVEDPNLLDQMTKKVYPLLGEAIASTESQTERAIRHAIEVAFDRIDPETLYEFFGNTINPMKGKPTNGEFLAMASQWVKRRLEEVV